MTDKEKIKAEIERHRQKIIDSWKEPDGIHTSVHDGHLMCCNVILSFIDSLPEEHVSYDLEEVCKKYRKKVHDELANIQGMCWEFDWDDVEMAIDDAFKAGAQWKEEQMMKTAVDGKVVARFPLASVPFYSDVEVYLNFTKGLSEGDKVKVIIIKKD